MKAMHSVEKIRNESDITSLFLYPEKFVSLICKLILSKYALVRVSLLAFSHPFTLLLVTNTNHKIIRQ